MEGDCFHSFRFFVIDWLIDEYIIYVLLQRVKDDEEERVSSCDSSWK